MFCLIGITAFIPAIVGYSFSFYGAVPDFRCRLPELANDTYEIQGDWHQALVNKYVPLDKLDAFKSKYDKCNLYAYSDTGNVTKQKCDAYVYSKQYFESTLITDWNLVCDKTSRKSLFSTLYFIGTYGVLLNGFLSDKFGRKTSAYMFVISTALLNIILSLLMYTKPFDENTQQILFAALRLLTGIASNVYSVCVVLAIEICGPTKRVMAANFVYYAYIFGEFFVVLFAYFVKDYRMLYAVYTALMCSIVSYFWMVPESPRWLITKNRINRAYTILKRIAHSNKKPIESLTELESLNMNKYEVNELEAEKLTSNASSIENVKQSTFSIMETVKIFFKSRKLIIRTTVTLLNWLTNTLVYYGISFNTSDLAGDPFLNFTLSVVVEFIAILTCQLTLERFGRKMPYSINMALTGVSLMLIQFIPSDMSYMVTVLALIGKFAISFTYNGVYIITSEIHPTVIRNSAVSICQTFARMGAVIAPNIQLLGQLYWYPIPFVVFGTFSIVSAITFVLFMPETKDRKLPDTIEEFMKS